MNKPPVGRFGKAPEKAQRRGGGEGAGMASTLEKSLHEHNNVASMVTIVGSSVLFKHVFLR